MINVFELQNGRLNQVPIDSKSDLENVAPIWVDMTDPTEEERSWVKSIYDVTMPDEDDVKDIEASARYYEAENGDLHLRTDFRIDDDEGPSQTVTVAFILARNMLFSMHAEDLPVFRLVRMRARSRPGSITDYKDVLLDLYRGGIDRDSGMGIHRRIAFKPRRQFAEERAQRNAFIIFQLGKMVAMDRRQRADAPLDRPVGFHRLDRIGCTAVDIEQACDNLEVIFDAVMHLAG